MDKKVFLYAAAVLLVLLVVLFTLFPGMLYAVKDSGNSSEEKCIAPESYTPEAWEEHMSHHPNIYRDCFP